MGVLTLQVFMQLPSGLIATARIRFEAATYDGFERRRHGGIQRSQRRRRQTAFFESAFEKQIGRRMSMLEWVPPREQLEQDDAERVEIAARVYADRRIRKRGEAFRGHVRQGA